MSPRLPRAATRRAAATLPPVGLDGLDRSWSRLVEVPESGLGGRHSTERLSNERPSGARPSRVWHVLDNADQLAALGVTPVGTLLCVHGNPTWSYLWRRLISAATDAAATGSGATGSGAWRVVAVDQLDMGFSERTGAFRPLARRVLDLADLTAGMGIDGPVVTVGHDWGGVVSLGWAVEHPDLLAGVILLNTAVHQPVGERIPAPLRLALHRPVLGAATVTTSAFLATTLSLAHPPLDPVVTRAYHAPYLTADRRGGIGGFVADIPVDASHGSAPELDRIAHGVLGLDVPALLLWGPRDPIFGEQYLDDLAQRLPDADIHRFEGAGHLLAEDADYASAALNWLTDLRGRGEEPRSKPERAAALAAAAEEEAPASAPPAGAEAAPPAPAPLWRFLDDLRDSADTALVELAPPSGAAPRVVSWRLLSRRVRQLAAGLARVGVKPGDRVSLLVPPGADLTAVLYACLRIGAVVVIADAGLGLPGLTRAVRGARPDHLIGAVPGLVAARALGWPGKRISTARLPAVSARALGVSHSLAALIELGADERMPPPPHPDDTAAVLFTSGSTGPAKGVAYTHAQLGALRDALAVHYGVGPGTGLVAGFAPFALLGPALGARTATPDMNITSPGTLTAVAAAAAVAAVDATVLFLSPAALANVVATAGELTAEHRLALGGVREFLSAGAPVSESLLAAAARLMPGASAHTPYGMTEGLLLTDITLDGIRDAASGDPAFDDASSEDACAGARAGATSASGTSGDDTAVPRPGGVCVGRATGSTRIRISALDGAGSATGLPTDHPGVTGEIVVSAAHLKDHYDRLWVTDRASRQGTIAGERWHRTGDVGHLDDAGRLWVEGRLPHIIVTASGVVTPVGPEQLVESVEGVSRAAVVGVGPRGTQQIVVIVETRPGARRPALASAALSASIRRRMRVSVAAVLVVPSLPTDIRHNSKIDRSRLSTWADGVLAGGRMTRP